MKSKREYFEKLKPVFDDFVDDQHQKSESYLHKGDYYTPDYYGICEGGVTIEFEYDTNVLPLYIPMDIEWGYDGVDTRIFVDFEELEELLSEWDNSENTLGLNASDFKEFFTQQGYIAGFNKNGGSTALKSNNMNKQVKEMVIDGVTYVPKSEQKQAETLDGMPYVMVRTYSAGVHCGYLKNREGKEVTLIDSIRIWKWAGAASLSQLSMEGTNDADNCKFGMPISTELILTESIEVIKMTETARVNIQNVESWKN